MRELFDCAERIARALTPECRMDYPAIAVLFDGDKFCGAEPIQAWRTLHDDITIPHDYIALICYDETPSWLESGAVGVETNPVYGHELLLIKSPTPTAHAAGV